MLQRNPSGLVIPAHARLSGRVRWRVLDERGVPEVPRSPSGFPLGPLEGVEQSNLITDSGLDALGTQAHTGNPSFRNWLKVGTGSTAPATTDTQLDNEVQRGSGAGLGNGATDFAYDAVEEVFTGEYVSARLVTLDFAQNLTEFGFSGGDDAGAHIRELFRDDSDTPVTISLAAGKTIDVRHTLIVRIDAPPDGTPGTLDIDEYDATDTLVNELTYDVDRGPTVNGVTSQTLLGLFGAWNPLGSADFYRVTAAGAYSPTSYPATTNVATGTLDEYVPSSYKRVRRGLTSAAGGAGDWYGVLARPSATGLNGGFIAMFTDPATYTKRNTDVLELTYESTWARG